MNFKHFMKIDSPAALLATRTYANASGEESSGFSKILMIVQNVLGESPVDWICEDVAALEWTRTFG